MRKPSKSLKFRLPSGLTARFYTLADHEAVAVKKASIRAGRRIGWFLANAHCDLREYPVVKVECGTNPVYLVYAPFDPSAHRKVARQIKDKPEETWHWLLLSFYRNKGYLFNDRTTKVLTNACQTGLPPEICALTAEEPL